MLQVVKEPEDERGVDYDFQPELGSLSISFIVTATATARGGGAPLTRLSQTFDGGIVRIVWGEGSDGEDYLTAVTVEDSQGRQHKIAGEILVRTHGFTVPDIPASPYLSAEDYVARAGREETVRTTDETRRGVIDPAKLARAIQDATEFADAYIRGRYSLPLPSIPTALQGAVFALARENLHRSRAIPAVTEAADRARSFLRDVSAGRALLALETGGEPEPKTRSLAAWGQSAQPNVFTDEKLKGFNGYPN